jgi:hypothetical protein
MTRIFYSKEGTMIYKAKTWLVGLAFILALVSIALAQGGKAEMVNGTHWKKATKEIKETYIIGIGNMADFEVAVSGKERAGCISAGFVDELKDKSIGSIIDEVDKFYKENPSKMDTPVIEVVLRKCTALCKPEAPAIPKKK